MIQSAVSTRLMLGLLLVTDLLAARQRHLEEERRERVLRMRLTLPLGRGPDDAVTGGT